MKGVARKEQRGKNTNRLHLFSRYFCCIRSTCVASQLEQFCRLTHIFDSIVFHGCKVFPLCLWTQACYTLTREGRDWCCGTRNASCLSVTLVCRRCNTSRVRRSKRYLLKPSRVFVIFSNIYFYIPKLF